MDSAASAAPKGFGRSRTGMIETRPQKTQERALLIGLEKEGVSKWDLQDSLDELRELANSAGAEVIDTVTQKLQKPTAPYYIGRGKAESIKDSCQDRQVTSVIFDDELSPAQGRNLENLFARKVLDRTQLILDIFAQRARSREGRLQIELAQLQYLLPRLTRMWHHLSRQTGGIGTRGPGETQLEVDRRRVQERIARLERELEAVRKTRAVQRQGRKRHQWPVAAVVGYTNAGKSTLLNLLTGADLVAENKLFATLDPTTRSFVLPNKQRVLLTDTVGFLRKLPHTLIESFKATLEEVSEADLLIHIVDLSHPRVDEQMEAVDSVIKELDAFGKQTLIVFNKIDNLENGAGGNRATSTGEPARVDARGDESINREISETYVKRFPGSVAISARTGEGVNRLVGALENALSSWRLRSRFRIPSDQSALIAEIHRVGHVLELRYEGDDALIVAHVPPELVQKLAHYATES
jgi:GTPase